MTNDPANPKDLIGRTKAPISLVPITAIKEAALALFLGKTKYGRSNWRVTPIYASIYFDALLRHAYRWWEGNEVDPEDGTPELGNAIACLCILIDAKVCGTLIDDRQFRGENAAAYINSDLGVMASIEQKYGDKKPHHYTIEDVVQASNGIVSVALNGGSSTDPAVITLGKVGPGIAYGQVPFSGGKA